MMITKAGFVLFLFLKCEQTVLIITLLLKNTATSYLRIVGVGLGFKKILQVKFLVKNLSSKSELSYRMITNLVVLLLNQRRR